MDFSEKRDFQRMAMDCSLQFKVSESAQSQTGKVLNLSAKGVLFISSEAIAPGSHVEIRLTPVSDITPPMSANTVVARCEKQADDEYQVAAEIVQIL